MSVGPGGPVPPYMCRVGRVFETHRARYVNPSAWVSKTRPTLPAHRARYANLSAWVSKTRPTLPAHWARNVNLLRVGLEDSTHPTPAPARATPLHCSAPRLPAWVSKTRPTLRVWPTLQRGLTPATSS